MRSMGPSHPESGLATAALVALWVSGAPTRAAEFHFVVQEVGEKQALWLPQEVVIHCSTEMQDGLVFVLENPTDRTLAFESPGLFEQIVEWGEAPTVKPLRVTVAPGETMQVQVSTKELADDPAMDAPENIAIDSSVRCTGAMRTWGARSW